MNRATSQPEVPHVGDVVAGKYEVERIIGEGGMGVVLAARHQQLGELVAIKLLHPKAELDGEAKARLLREAKATISIKSEHVVRIIDVGTLQSGAPYIIMEHLDGHDLASVIMTRQKLPIAEAIDYVLQAGEAIAEAHSRGIVHRDLKPSNLFLTQRADGSALLKVLDFGIAKATLEEPNGNPSNSPSLTATTAVFGSPAYMSPEQLRSAKRVDQRTDIWSLGVILFELLTGRMPFSGETTAGILAAIAADEPIALRSILPAAPEALDRIIHQCLVKDIQQRVQTMAELATALGPLGPPGSDTSVQRIVRLFPGGGSRPSLSSALPPPSSSNSELQIASTVKAITTDVVTAPVPPPRRSMLPRAAGFAALLVLGGVATFIVMDRKQSAATPHTAAGAITPSTVAAATSGPIGTLTTGTVPIGTAATATEIAPPPADPKHHTVAVTHTTSPAHTSTPHPAASASASASAATPPVVGDHALDGR